MSLVATTPPSWKRRLRRGLQQGVRSTQRAFGLKPRAYALILACPRSGTTAMRNWLNTQPRLVEVPQTRILIAASHFLSQCERFDALIKHRPHLLHSLQRDVHSTYTRSSWIWRRLAVDKENLDPIGFPQSDFDTYLRHARELLPGLRIVLMVRDPLATIWSMTQRSWGTTLVDTSQLREFTLSECINVWRTAGEFVLRAAEDADTYLCHFESLVTQPQVESERIARFLGLQNWSPFEARDTKTVGFTAEERDQVQNGTANVWEQLLRRRG